MQYTFYGGYLLHDGETKGGIFLKTKRNVKKSVAKATLFLMINNFLFLPRNSFGDERKRGTLEALFCRLRDVRNYGIPT